MIGISLRYHHWTYVWFPVVAAIVWFGTLWAMLITWLAQSRPRYDTMDGKIPYISDIGADILKPLFVASCAVTAIGFFLSLFVERWLRHSGRSVCLEPLCIVLLDRRDNYYMNRLVPNMRRRERVCGTLAVLGSVLGGAGLILLSVFDTKKHQTAHRLFLLVFIVGVGLSAIFTVVEVISHA